MSKSRYDTHTYSQRERGGGEGGRDYLSYVVMLLLPPEGCWCVAGEGVWIATGFLYNADLC